MAEKSIPAEKSISANKSTTAEKSATTEKSIESRAFAGIPDDWHSLIVTSKTQKILKSLKGQKFTPAAENIFEFAKLTPLRKVKAIIIGQDPYPKVGDAHGLAFSCLTNIPASLKNIYKCLQTCKLIKEYPTTGNLEYWAKQGVLLINRSLTTVVGVPNSHVALWDEYTKTLVSALSSYKPLIFMLWGNNARELVDYIDETSTVFEWSHPSPLAQSKQKFTDCPHFVDANKLLVQLGHEPIDWNVSPPKSEIEEAFGATDRTQVVFTDGSCFPNNSSPEARGGYAASFAVGSMSDIIIYGNLDTSVAPATNQRAEGVAMLKVLEYLVDNLDEFDECIIVSDSEFWIKMFEEYMPAWARTNKFDQKKNPDLTKAMWRQYKALTDTHEKSIVFRHMKSHGKDNWHKKPEGSYEHFCYVNNNYVDELATYARTNLEQGECVTGTADTS